MRCQGPRVLARCLLDCPMPRAAEAVAGALVRLHGDPAARRLGVGAGGGLARLDVAVAPFTEFRYVHQGEEATQDGGDGEKKPAVVGFAAAMAQDEADRERRFQCGRQVRLFNKPIKKSSLLSYNACFRPSFPWPAHGAALPSWPVRRRRINKRLPLPLLPLPPPLPWPRSSTRCTCQMLRSE